jgi:hypothetical protein
MNNETINIDGQDYEVLTFGKYAECETVSHGLLGNGILLECTYAGEATYQVDGYIMSSQTILKWGIQPLKLIERKPVEFVGEAVTVCQGSIDGKPGLHRLVEFSVPEDVWQHIEKGMKFQITEGESILKAKGVS